MSSSTAPGTMLYDADCGFCTRSAAWVPHLGLRAAVDTIQASRLPGVDAARAQREIPFVHPDGTVVYGHRAVAAVLRTGPLPWRLLGQALDLPGLRSLAAHAYAWVSAHRHRLPGGSTACAVERPEIH